MINARHLKFWNNAKNKIPISINRVSSNEILSLRFKEFIDSLSDRVHPQRVPQQRRLPCPLRSPPLTPWTRCWSWSCWTRPRTQTRTCPTSKTVWPHSNPKWSSSKQNWRRPRFLPHTYGTKRQGLNCNGDCNKKLDRFITSNDFFSFLINGLFLTVRSPNCQNLFQRFQGNNTGAITAEFAKKIRSKTETVVAVLQRIFKEHHP